MSDGLERVTIVTPDAPAPAGHDEKMVALVDAAANPERPDWLPAKFTSVEQMAQSYKELEAKLSSPKEATTAAPAGDAPAAPLSIPATADDAVKSAGLDMAALNAEFAKDGALSEASRAKLATAGFDKATVDSYIEGRQAVANAFTSEVKGVTPGGAEKYTEMIEWAKLNLTEPEIAAYNSTMNTSNKEQAKLAVAGLGAKFAAAVGNEPRLQGGRVGGSQSDVFESIAQMTTAMSDPKYKTDPAYRRVVMEKLGRSSIL